jgi:hypothetical protein
MTQEDKIGMEIQNAKEMTDQQIEIVLNLLFLWWKNELEHNLELPIKR